MWIKECYKTRPRFFLISKVANTEYHRSTHICVQTLTVGRVQKNPTTWLPAKQYTEADMLCMYMFIHDFVWKFFTCSSNARSLSIRPRDGKQHATTTRNQASHKNKQHNCPTILYMYMYTMSCSYDIQVKRNGCTTYGYAKCHSSYMYIVTVKLLQELQRYCNSRFSKFVQS